MKKVFKYAVIAIVATILAFVLGVSIWYNYLEYYWHTERVQLYQKDKVMRICRGEKPINPSWNVTKENQQIFSEAENFVKQGLPITINVRGVISGSGSEVFIEEIFSVKSGVNPDCELTP